MGKVERDERVLVVVVVLLGWEKGTEKCEGGVCYRGRKGVEGNEWWG